MISQRSFVSLLDSQETTEIHRNRANTFLNKQTIRTHTTTQDDHLLVQRSLSLGNVGNKEDFIRMISSDKLSEPDQEVIQQNLSQLQEMFPNLNQTVLDAILKANSCSFQATVDYLKMKGW